MLSDNNCISRCIELNRSFLHGNDLFNSLILPKKRMAIISNFYFFRHNIY